MSEHGLDAQANSIRIIIVDDHPIVREGLKAMLGRETGFTISGDVGTTAAALDLVREVHPHVAIVDVLMDRESGLDLIRKIAQSSPTVKVLACSMYDDRLYAERALAAGALGYINKRVAGVKIVEVIRGILRGEVYLNDETKQEIINRSVASGLTRPRTPIESFSNRELEIFRLVGQGLTIAEICERVDLSKKTVEAHCQKIRRNLQLDNAQQLAREAAQWFLENG